jgi:hypothetical protein
VAITRDRLATTTTFWRDRHRDDAVKTLRDTLAKLDALDDAMSADDVDPAAVRSRGKSAPVVRRAIRCIANRIRLPRRIE